MSHDCRCQPSNDYELCSVGCPEHDLVLNSSKSVVEQAPSTQLTFAEFSRMNMKRHREWPRKDRGSENWDLSAWGCAVAEEAGEVCGAIKRINRITNKQIMNGGTQRVHTMEDALELLKKEIGDVCTYLDLLAQEAGSNLEECLRMAYNGVSEREGLPHKI